MATDVMVQSQRPPEHAWIVSIGTELSLGRTVDTNAAWLARRCAALGIHTDRQVTVPDEPAHIRDAIGQATQNADLVLITGGLGPTDDDLTRFALAEVAGAELELHPPSLEHLRSFFASRGREMPEPNRIQAMIPRTGEAIANSCGTAPGIQISLSGTPCYALPGVPFEMRTMFERSVAPQLAASAAGRILLSRQLHCFGYGESDLAAKINDLMARDRNPQVGTAAEFGVIGIRLDATAAARDAAEAMLDETETEIRGRLGNIIFGRDDDTLPAVVGQALTARDATLGVAESCTGGLITKLLTDVPGSSAYFVGGTVAYANEVKTRLLNIEPELLQEHGAVSDAVAKAMAVGVRNNLSTSYSVATTGIAGPEGGTAQKPVGLVYIGWATSTEAGAKRFLFGSDAPREAIRTRAALAALNLLRLKMASPGTT